MASRLQPKPKKRQREVHLLLVLEVLLVLGVGLAITSAYAALVEKGYQISRLQAANQEMRVTNERVELDLAQLQGPEKISQLARQRLNMQPPGTEDYIYVANQVPVSRGQEPSQHVQVVNLAPEPSRITHRLTAILQKLSLVEEVAAAQN